MEIIPTALDGVVEIRPVTHGDDRGWFREVFKRDVLAGAGIDIDWIQDNESFSAQTGTLRGIHWQSEPTAQDKLIRVLAGAVLDVAVDLRRSSDTFGQHVAVELTAATGNQLLVPKGFGHAFLTLVPNTQVSYKVSAPYSPTDERALRFDDPDLGVAWPDLGLEFTLSDKDRVAPLFADEGAEFFA